ncbi:L-type lectin-domain containing receptor kinase SIT2-like [Lolium rigidum]|uniref:L-type lectin-domain containing receptor kinase SIT2-like n=1 Tax=Lolium rigidum TaxID=89674 RepID=UPI001F5DCFBA|nr:L-type lectin-domain containing receptor kinase SIT2-like [Lolium rigidum]
MKLFFLCFLLSFGLVASFTATSDDQLLYLGFTAGTNLTVDDAATVKANGLLELTNGSLGCKGHAFYPIPFHFRKSHNDTVQSFSVSFVFAIRSSYPIMSRQGLAFIITPSMNFSDALANQYLGFMNSKNNGNFSNHIFAIELDTVLNIEFQDINTNHVGIDINGLHSIKSYPAGYYEDWNGSFQNMTLASGDAMQVWVDYNAEAKKINVTMAPLQMEKPTRPLISADYDLSIVLKEPSYIGFSSSGGEVDSRHYVLGWSFGMNKPAPQINIAKLPRLPHPKHQPKLLKIILPIVSATFIFVVGSMVILHVRRKSRYSELKEDWEVEFGPHRLSYKELFHATEGFKNKHLLGAGGFGKVYKGILPSTKLEVAVKRVSHESRQGLKEFVAEVVSIGRIRHRNLVQLLGYCRRKGELLLVYDYMPNGSLDKYLYCDEQTLALNWAQRFRIIKDIASGLFYLHERWEKVVIHRDIKASNVLLDSEMNGRLGDFGLARLHDHGANLQTTHVVGTIGYLAPELVCTGKATPLTDVFAFGMFLLEVACGKRPVNSNPQGNQPLLVDWVLEHWNKGALSEVVDTRLQSDYNVDEACLVLKLGLLCAHPFANVRPNMQSIIRYLDGDSQLPELTDTDMSFSLLSIMQGEGFDPYALSYLSSKMSIGTISDISGGR